MGLDAWLYLDRYYIDTETHPPPRSPETGLKLDTVRMRLCYWRNYYKLNSFVLSNFAESADGGIAWLDIADLEALCRAIGQNSLLEEGADGAEDITQKLMESIAAIQDARRLLLRNREEAPCGYSDSVIYSASW